MPSQAGLNMLLQAFQNAQRSVQGIQDNQRQAQADALNQQLLKLRIDQQKMQLDALKHEQEKEKMRQGFKEQFLSGIQAAGQQAAPSASLGPEMQGPPAPPAQPDIAGQYRQLAGLASQGGPESIDLLNNLVAQGAIQSPASALQQRSKEATVRSQEATADIQEQSLAESKMFMQTRAALAKTLKARASTAKGIDKQRLELMSQVMETANEGQVPGILTELFPRVEEPTSAFQALYRQTGNAQKALKIMGDMEVQNAIAIQNAKPIKPRNMGEAREAISAEMFNGKAYMELTSEQMMAVNKRVEEGRQRIAKASAEAEIASRPLPSGAAGDLVDIRTLKLTVDSVLKQFKPEYVGKTKFIKNKIAILRGSATPELIAFQADYNNMIDILARDRTGAVIGPKEAKSFMEIAGSLFNEPDVFIGRAQTFFRHLDMRENVLLDVNTQSAASLKGQTDLSKMSAEQLNQMWQESK